MKEKEETGLEAKALWKKKKKRDKARNFKQREANNEAIVRFRCNG